eukprot:2910192-Rhodomonas_salina.2
MISPGSETRTVSQMLCLAGRRTRHARMISSCVMSPSLHCAEQKIKAVAFWAIPGSIYDGTSADGQGCVEVAWSSSQGAAAA